MINQMREATRRFEVGIETVLKPFALSLPQFELLTEVYAGPEQNGTLGDYAAYLHCTRGNLTGIADRLEIAGLIVREHNKEDRRVVNLFLTSHGENLAAQATLAVDAYLQATGSHVTARTGVSIENVGSILDVIDKQGVPA